MPVTNAARKAAGLPPLTPAQTAGIRLLEGLGLTALTEGLLTTGYVLYTQQVPSWHVFVAALVPALAVNVGSAVVQWFREHGDQLLLDAMPTLSPAQRGEVETFVGNFVAREVPKLLNDLYPALMKAAKADPAPTAPAGIPFIPLPAPLPAAPVYPPYQPFWMNNPMAPVEAPNPNATANVPAQIQAVDGTVHSAEEVSGTPPGGGVVPHG